MLRYFAGSYVITVFGLIAAYFWGEHVHPGGGLACVFIALVLSVLEVSLSFDNAVVNAIRLENMSQIWRHRFLTWGIVVAVFGMRLLFPLLVVALFAKISILEVGRLALSDVNQYTHYLHQTHAPIITFGGMFLLMLFLRYFFNYEKDIHWIRPIEKHLAHLDQFKGIEVVISLSILLLLDNSVLAPGIWGIIIYLIIDGLSHYLGKAGDIVTKGGIVAFMYLELIDASFSLDGVLGAFALSKDIVIITIGLAIGAMFVRSLTIMLVEKKTLAKFRYLEHGAHWAIGALAIIMLVSTIHEVPEVVTGLVGLVFITASLISSIMHNKKMERLLA